MFKSIWRILGWVVIFIVFILFIAFLMIRLELPGFIQEILFFAAFFGLVWFFMRRTIDYQNADEETKKIFDDAISQMHNKNKL